MCGHTPKCPTLDDYTCIMPKRLPTVSISGETPQVHMVGDPQDDTGPDFLSEESTRLAATITVLNPGGVRMLDLFSGTGSAASVYREAGFEVTTLDNDPRWGADITQDILEWDYTIFPPGYFHTVVCAPPCTDFSKAKTTQPRNLELADSLVLRALEVIQYLTSQFWWLENPRHGLLRTRPYMQGLPFVDADYCQYTDSG